MARIFSSKSVSLKSYSIIFRLYNRSAVRLVIDECRSAILGRISGFNVINNFQMFPRRDSDCVMALEWTQKINLKRCLAPIKPILL